MTETIKISGPPKRRIAIIGSRTFPLPAIIWDDLDVGTQAEAAKAGRALVADFVSHLSPSQHIVVSGGARGVDSWAEEFAAERGIEVVSIKPEWKKYGKSAGFKRNKEIVANSDDVVAFWDGQSRGTLDTVRKAHKAQKPYAIFGPDGEIKLAVTEEVYQTAEGTTPAFHIPKGS